MADHAATNSGLVLSNRFYDILRFFVEKGFPGFGVAYATVAALWHWGYTFEVGGTFAALSVLGSVFLTMARKGYTPEGSGTDGEVVPNLDPDAEHKYLLQLNAPMDELVSGKSVISFKVLDPSA